MAVSPAAAQIGARRRTPAVVRLKAGLLGLFAVLTVTLQNGPATALSPRLSLGESTVEVWGLRDGLTGSMVRAIAQTDDGYLWIAGFGGVARYDGARIVRLEIEPPLDVVGIVPGPDGTLKIIPRRGPIVCAQRGVLSPCPPSTPHLRNNARVYAILRSKTGEVLIGSDLGIYRPQGNALVLDPKAQSLDFGELLALHKDRTGTLWVGGSKGLFRETSTGFAPYPETSEPVFVRSFFETSDGRLWILTDKLLLKKVGATLSEIPVPPDLAVGWNSEVIEDRDGNVWIGGQKGLGRYRDGRFELYGKSDGLPDEAISALFEDREGSLWVGTRSGSLAQFTDRTVPTKLGPPMLADESIESVAQDAEGDMWFGNRLGLLRWRPRPEGGGSERLFTTADGLPTDRVYVAIPARAGGLWVGTAGGLARYRNGRIDRPIRFEAQVFSLYEDRQGTLWLGTDNGLARLDGDTVTRLPAENFDPKQVRGIAEDDEGVMWVSSIGGLGQVREGRLVMPQAPPEITAADRGMTRDANGALWFAVGTGLVERRAGKFRVIPAPLGKSRDWLFQVLPDDHGYLWFGASRSISRVASATLERETVPRTAWPVITFDMTDTRREIGARRARNAGAWKARDGRLWFATLRGMVTIDPAEVRTNTQPPPVLIERAVVDGRSALHAEKTVFPPGPGNLEFQYAGVTLLEPRKAQHRYRLEGFDKDWIDAGTRRVAYYTNIPPGKYRFQVQASNADGIWNEAGAVLPLELAPHFYQTVWFYGLCALSVGGLAFLVYRARLLQLRGQYLAVFAERGRVARELHDSLLQGMSAVALELANIRKALPGNAGKAAERLEAVEDALTQSLEETRRFVWNLREQPTGAGDLSLALSRLAGRLTEGRPITCKVDVEGTPVHLSHDAQGALFKIAQEAITNALRHAEAKTINVSLRYREREVELGVADDGRGFDPATARGPEEKHFGLVGMEERARRLGARLNIESRPGAGARITFVVPTGSRRTADA